MYWTHMCNMWQMRTSQQSWPWLPQCRIKFLGICIIRTTENATWYGLLVESGLSLIGPWNLTSDPVVCPSRVAVASSQRWTTSHPHALLGDWHGILVDPPKPAVTLEWCLHIMNYIIHVLPKKKKICKMSHFSFYLSARIIAQEKVSNKWLNVSRLPCSLRDI